MNTTEVENFPASPRIQGPEPIDGLQEQAEELGDRRPRNPVEGGEKHG